jgi:guanyl-specific ribonuclease Sa
MGRVARLLILLLAALAIAHWWSPREPAGGSPEPARAARSLPPGAGEAERAPEHYPGFLPGEAVATLELIERGGPYPYDRDGSVFQNRERRLPEQPRGYYREYTVDTPGSPDRGARRIVTGGDPPEVYYYTDDHYRSFRAIEVPR